MSDLNAQDDRIALTAEERAGTLAFLDETDAIFAAWPHEGAGGDDRIETLVQARLDAKAARNWVEADRIRNELKDLGIVLEDRKDGGTAWHRA